MCEARNNGLQLGRAVTSAGRLSCLPRREGSFSPAKPALIFRSHTHTPYPWAAAGRGAAASTLAETRRDFSAEAQSWLLLPCSFTAGQGFRLSPAAEGAKSCPVTSLPRPREQQEDPDLQSQSGHPCPAAANAPNLPENPGDLLAGPRGTACVMPCAGGGATTPARSGWGSPAGGLPGPPQQSLIITVL